MKWIPGGTFVMGCDDGPDDEKPAHEVTVGQFEMDETEVTNAQFARFVEATGYVTTAEKTPDWEELKKQVPPGTPKPPAEFSPLTIVRSGASSARRPGSSAAMAARPGRPTTSATNRMR